MAQRLKVSACNAGDLGSIPGLRRSLGEGNGNPLWYSSLGKPMDRGGCRSTVHGIAREGQDLATKPPLLLTLITMLYIRGSQPQTPCLVRKQSAQQEVSGG